MKQTAPVRIVRRFFATYEGFCSSLSVQCQLAAHLVNGPETAKANSPRPAYNVPIKTNRALIPSPLQPLPLPRH